MKTEYVGGIWFMSLVTLIVLGLFASSVTERFLRMLPDSIAAWRRVPDSQCNRRWDDCLRTEGALRRLEKESHSNDIGDLAMAQQIVQMEKRIAELEKKMAPNDGCGIIGCAVNHGRIEIIGCAPTRNALVDELIPRITYTNGTFQAVTVNATSSADVMTLRVSQ